MENPELPDSVEILGIRVDCLDETRLIDCALNWVHERAPRTICYVNAHSMNIAWSDLTYQKILAEASLVYADGVSIVWSSKILSGTRLEKMTGADWMAALCSQAASRGVTLHILAGKPGIAKATANNLQKRYAALKIVGFADGFFLEKDQDAVLEEISIVKPDILFVGMGTPLQEKWIHSHRTNIAAPVCWAVGGLFDYFSGDLRRAPGWMLSSGLEWFWLLLIQPRQKWRRYLLGNPLFVYRVLRQKLLRSTPRSDPKKGRS